MYEENKESFVGLGEESTQDKGINDANSNVGSMPLPGVNFTTFIFSLNSAALVQLGILTDPVSGDKSTDFILAKHTIDTISMLKEKTEGNLSSEESKMILDILYDLKMFYVNRHK